MVYKDSNQVERARTPRGFMFDSKVEPLSGEPASSTGVDYALIPRGKGVALQVTLTDRAWIDSAERVPIIVGVLAGAVINSATLYAAERHSAVWVLARYLG